MPIAGNTLKNALFWNTMHGGGRDFRPIPDQFVLGASVFWPRAHRMPATLPSS
jgi:hypothetical protein